MLLGRIAYCTIVHDGAPRDGVSSFVDGHGRIHEIPVGIAVTHAQLSELAGRSRDSILMALGAGRGVEDRTKPGRRVVNQLKLRLVHCKAISSRLGYSIAG